MSVMIWESHELAEIYKRLPMQRNDHNRNVVAGFKMSYPYSTVENMVQWAIQHHTEIQWIPEPPKPAPPPPRISPGISLKEFDEWVNKSPELCQDDHNRGVFIAWIKANPNGTIHDLAAYTIGNSAFNWIQSNEKPQLRGTAAEKLFQVGAAATSLQSHTEKFESPNWFQDIKNQAKKHADSVEHRKAVQSARALTVYLPNGKPHHSRTAELRRAALEKLGIFE